MAGLAAAVALVRRGVPVRLYEAARHAGGRCRSFYDARLDRTIDNGNHLLLSGNRSVARYVRWIGSGDAFIEPRRAEFPFVDVRSGERWCVRPGSVRFLGQVFSRQRRIPGTGAWEYLRLLRYLVAPTDATVHQASGKAGRLFERFVEPLAVGALNAPASEGAACLLRPVLLETFLRGERYCRPCVARRGLSEALVTPAITLIESQGAQVHLSTRLEALAMRSNVVVELVFGHATVECGPRDTVILGVPPEVAQRLLGSLRVPRGHSAIVNAHYRLEHPEAVRYRPAPLTGLVGGMAQWVFLREDIASVTVSAAGALVRQDGAALASRLWRDTAQALGIPEDPLPRWRIIKERQATFRQTPGNAIRRPGTSTWVRNVVLAGDWTDTGLPATIEGAVRSGFAAAEHAVRWRQR